MSDSADIKNLTEALENSANYMERMYQRNGSKGTDFRHAQIVHLKIKQMLSDAIDEYHSERRIPKEFMTDGKNDSDHHHHPRQPFWDSGIRC